MFYQVARRTQPQSGLLSSVLCCRWLPHEWMFLSPPNLILCSDGQQSVFVFAFAVIVGWEAVKSQ